LSPAIVSKIKDSYDRERFFLAVKTELSELSFQLCLTAFKLGQEYGQLTKGGVEKTKVQLMKYKGSENIKSILDFIDALLNYSDENFTQVTNSLKLDPGRSLSLKNHSTILIDSNAIGISRLPIELQSKIYEFKNKLNIYNQEVIWLREHVKLTFDPNITVNNHQNVTTDIYQRYADLQKICESLCIKTHAILESKL
jgi:hypothetical protein